MQTGTAWNPWLEFGNVRREMSSLLGGGPRWSGEAPGPAFNVYAGERGVVLTAELPGFDPAAFDVSVKGEAVTVRGKRAEEAGAGARYQVRERADAEFEKTFRLPFPADAEKTEAAYEKGVLTVTLHRPEEQKPQKIGVRTA